MALFSWFSRLKAGGSASAASARRQKAPQYNAVEIVPRKRVSCEAVRSIVGRRFLPEDAPLVPLRDCDQADCGCSYRRYDDRRNDIRRAGDLGFAVFSNMVLEKNDRRQPKEPGRRAADHEAD